MSKKLKYIHLVEERIRSLREVIIKTDSFSQALLYYKNHICEPMSLTEIVMAKIPKWHAEHEDAPRIYLHKKSIKEKKSKEKYFLIEYNLYKKNHNSMNSSRADLRILVLASPYEKAVKKYKSHFKKDKVKLEKYFKIRLANKYILRDTDTLRI